MHALNEVVIKKGRRPIIREEWRKHEVSVQRAGQSGEVFVKFGPKQYFAGVRIVC